MFGKTLTQKVKAMPKKTLHHFSIERLNILDPEGKLLDDKVQLNPLLLRRMFEQMLVQREFDAKSISLQRQGRMGTYASALGQEAVHIGSAAALRAEDWAVPCFREQGVYLYRGIPAKTLFVFFMGSEEGNRIPRDQRTLPYCVPCATQILHAVGLAQAAKIQGSGEAVITYFGDGATSEGDFHEGLNWAAVTQSPVVFLCQNNQFAISTPNRLQYHSPTLAQRGIAYDMPALQVDGNDVLAVYEATREALERARSGKGPTLLECITYRMDAHTTSDDPLRYRKDSEIQIWRAKDPINRLERFLLHQGLLKPGEKESLLEDIRLRLKEAAEAAEAICTRLSPDEMFNYLFHQLPPALKQQREEVLGSLTEPEESLHA